MSEDKITRKPKKVQAVPEFCMINKLHVHCVDDVLSFCVGLLTSVALSRCIDDCHCDVDVNIVNL